MSAIRAAGASVRLFASLLTARAVFGAWYLASSLGRWTIPWYYPLARTWRWSSEPEGFAMDWYGRTGLALLAAAFAAGGMWLASGRPVVSRWLARPAAVLAIAHAGAMILVVDYVYFGWVMMHQTPAPLPLPAPPGG